MGKPHSIMRSVSSHDHSKNSGTASKQVYFHITLGNVSFDAKNFSLVIEAWRMSFLRLSYPSI